MTFYWQRDGGSWRGVGQRQDGDGSRYPGDEDDDDMMIMMISPPENQQRDPAAETQVRLDVSPEDSAQLAGGEGAEGEN